MVNPTLTEEEEFRQADIALGFATEEDEFAAADAALGFSIEDEEEEFAQADIALGFAEPKKPGFFKKAGELAVTAFEKTGDFIQSIPEIPGKISSFLEEQEGAPQPDPALTPTEVPEPGSFVPIHIPPEGLELTDEEHQQVQDYAVETFGKNPFPEFSDEDKRDIAQILIDTGNETLAGRFVQGSAAFGRGVIKSIPGAQSALGEEFTESPQGQTLEEEFPAESIAGAVTGTIGQVIAGGGATAAALAKTAVGKSPILMTALARAIPATALRGAQTAEQIAQGKIDVSEGLFNTIVESGGGAAFSMIPEIVFSPGVAQLIVQPLADVVYQAGVDLARGKGEEVLGPEWFKEQIPTIAASMGFAIKDVTSGAEFKATQGRQRAEIKEWMGGKGDAGYEIITTPEGMQVLGEKGLENIDNIIRAEETRLAETEATERPTQVIKTDDVKKFKEKKSGALDVKKAEKTEISEEELATLPDPEKAPTDPVKPPEVKPVQPDADKPDVETPAKPKPDKKEVPISKGTEAEKEQLVTAQKDIQKETETISSARESQLEKLDTELERVQAGSDVRKSLTGFEEKAIKGNQWDLITGKKTRDRRGNLIVRTEATEKVLQGIADDYNLAKAEGRDATTRLLPPDRVLNEVDNWSADDVADLISQGVKTREFKALQKDIAGRKQAIEDETELAYEDIGKRGEEISAKMREAGIGPTEAELFGKSFQEPETKKNVGVDDLERKRGLLSDRGGKGEEQFKIKIAEVAKDDVSKSQAMFDSQRKALKDKFGFNKDRFIDKWLSRTVDVNAPIKRRLLKNDDGRKVVMHHDLHRGASAEAVRAFEVEEKKIWNTVPHKYENIFDDYIQAERTIELSKLKGEDFKSPGGLSEKEMTAWKAEIEKQDPILVKNLKVASEKYWKEISTNTLNRYVEEGIMTRKFADQLLKEQPHYSPREFMQHIDPETAGFDNRGRQVNVPDSGIKKLDEGSEEALMNNARLLLADVISRRESRIFKNRANKALHEFATKNPDNEIGVKTEKPIGKNKDGSLKYPDVPADMTRISAMVDGEQKTMLMPTEMAKYWVTSDPLINRDFARFLNIASGSALLKPMATGLNPAFALSNMPRDIIHSWFTTQEYSPILPVAWAQQAKDFITVARDVKGRRGRVTDYIKEGGGMDFLTQQGQIRKRPWEPQSATTESINQLQNFLGWAGETSELWTRIALRERAIRGGKSSIEATHIARNYIDFAQGGSWTKVADNAVPYLNAATVGSRGIVRAFKENPKVAAFKAAQVMGLSYGLAYWNYTLNQENWDSISEREKSNKFIITTPFSWADKDGNKRWLYFAISKDQGQRLFSSIGEEMANMANGVEVNFEKLKMSATDLLPVDIGVGIPSLSGLWGYVYNKDFWKNEDIWKGRKGVTPKEEYWNETPKPWVLWGKATDLSPERSRAAFNKVVPQNFYTYLMEGFAGQFFGTLKEKDKQKVNSTFIQKITEFPALRRIARSTFPATHKSEELLKKANKLMVETQDDKGEPVNLRILKRRVEKAETELSDKRINNDRKFAFLIAAANVGNKDTQKILWDEMVTLGKTDISEFERIMKKVTKSMTESALKNIPKE